MKIRFFNQALIAALVVVPGIASADILNFVGPDMTNTYNMDITSSSPYNGGVYVGSLSVTLNSNPNPFDVYCVDLDHDITAGASYPVTIIHTDTLAISDPAYYAAGNIYAAVHGSVTNADQASGLQIALWDTVAPGEFTFNGSGSSLPSSAVLAYAATDLGFASTPGDALYYKQNSGVGQSMIGAVPEPASFAVLGIGAMGLLRRRKR